jgi:hypothetical protein
MNMRLGMILGSFGSSSRPMNDPDRNVRVVFTLVAASTYAWKCGPTAVLLLTIQHRHCIAHCSLIHVGVPSSHLNRFVAGRFLDHLQACSGLG